MYFVVSCLPEKYSPMRPLLRIRNVNRYLHFGSCFLCHHGHLSFKKKKVNNTNYHRIQFTCCRPIIKNKVPIQEIKNSVL